MSKNFFNIVVAKTYITRGIGYNNTIPWILRDDLRRFREITTSNKKSDKFNSVIMGKNTWMSLPKKPLYKRNNIIVSKTLYNENKYMELGDTYYVSNFEDGLNIAKYISNDTFVIGGENIYREALNHELCKKLYITDIYNYYDCDTYFPSIDEDKYNLTEVSNMKKENGLYYRYLTYCRNELVENRHNIEIEEYQLLELMRNIIDNGECKSNRTGVSTYSIFSPKKLYYDLEKAFPMITTKKMFIRGIFEELMFILRGQTDNKILVDKNVNIWTANTSKEFMEKNNLKLEENDMGETYGFNMRYFGEKYIDCKSMHVNLKNNSDQLTYLINLLKTDHNSRRMIINLWNPTSLDNCALPPCLMLYQFNIVNNKLNLQATLRSSDVYLANAWNTVFCALFVNLLCNIKGVNLTPGKLSINIGDAHIYENHLEGVEEQLQKKPRPFPILEVIKKHKNITDFEYEDLKLIGYNPHKNSKNMCVDMAV